MWGMLRSAGLLPYRLNTDLKVLLAHPGGPFFSGRDDGWWSIVKGMVESGEGDEAAAIREFEEETGWPAPAPPWIPLGETILKSRKRVVAWAVRADFDPSTLDPGTFVMNGRRYPEIDRVEWFSADEAIAKLNRAQSVFIERLLLHLSGTGNN